MQEKGKANYAQTVLVIVLGFLVLHLVFEVDWALRVALIVGILGLLSNQLAKLIHVVWMKLTWLLSLIVPNILLSLVFFIVLTPIAWASRIFGEKNQLQLKNSNSTLFRETNKSFDKASFEKTW